MRSKHTGMTIYVDVDRTLCTFKHVNGRKTAIPNRDVIARVNKLYDDGNTIVIYTARGRTNGKGYKELTERQLEEWGVLYHSIDYDKPLWDLLIDDKVINVYHWMQGMELPDVNMETPNASQEL
uniref:FCP1 homology domain-containing protein n=1 Tax=viral metagenome TaxID=1070528 RepID=A0A6M3IZ15_9ZZZZ